MNNTSMRSDEVDGAFPIHHNVRQKVPDTRRGDDGVQFSTPRSRNEIDGAFSRTLPLTNYGLPHTQPTHAPG